VPHPQRLLLAVPLALAIMAWGLWWAAVLPAAVLVITYWLSGVGVLLSFMLFRWAPLLTTLLALVTLAMLLPLATMMFAMTIWLIRGFAP